MARTLPYSGAVLPAQTAILVGPILRGHSGPLCHALSLLSSSSLSWTSMRRRHATVATPGEWQCKTGGVRRLAVANGPNIFLMLLVYPSESPSGSADPSDRRPATAAAAKPTAVRASAD